MQREQVSHASKGGRRHSTAVPDTVKANHPLPKSLTRQVHTPWQEAEVSAAAINEGAKADKKTTDGRHLVADSSYS